MVDKVSAQNERSMLPLLYHELRAEASPYSYVLPTSRFAEHLALFARLRRAPASNLLPLVTFDDGHLSNHAYAMPMLQDAGMRAHFFITAGWTGTRAGYMEPQHLRELHDAGHTVGAHSWSHALLTGCSDADLRHELCDTKQALENWIGAPVHSLSLPGGRGDARVLRACREAGYTTVWTSVPGSTRSATEPLIGRYNILAAITDETLAQLLNPASGKLRRAGQISRMKAAAQQALGDRLYARLWAVVNRQQADISDTSDTMPESEGAPR